MMLISITLEQVIQAHDFFLYVKSFISPSFCKEVWGPSGEHYILKYEEAHQDVIYFFSRLDGGNQRMLFQYYLDNKDN